MKKAAAGCLPASLLGYILSIVTLSSLPKITR